MLHVQGADIEEAPLRLSPRNDVRELRLLLFLLETRKEVVDEHGVSSETTRTSAQKLDSFGCRGSSVTSANINGHRIPNPASWGNDRPLGFPQGGGVVTRCCGWLRSRRVRAEQIMSPQQYPDRGGFGPGSKTPSSPYLRVVQAEPRLGAPMPSALPRVVLRTDQVVSR